MNKHRRTLLITALLFATPVLIAVILHQFPGIINFTGTKNHGTLIQPPRPIDSLRLVANNKNLNRQSFEGRWTYVVFTHNACDKACEERLYKTRQVRHALGKDMDKAQRLLILLDEKSIPAQEILEGHQDMTVSQAVSVGEWKSVFSVDRGAEDIVTDHIYLLDPVGNLMMFYPKEVEGRLILKDLQQLVKVSWIKPK